MTDIQGLDEAKAKLQALREALTGAQMKRKMRTIGEMLSTSVDESFDNESSAFGDEWKPTSRGGQILADSGRLKGSFVVDATSDTVTLGTNVEYAAIHQFGGELRPKKAKALRFQVGGRWVIAKKVTIPARPFLPVKDNTLAPNLVLEITEYLEGEIGKVLS